MEGQEVYDPQAALTPIEEPQRRRSTLLTGAHALPQRMLLRACCSACRYDHFALHASTACCSACCCEAHACCVAARARPGFESNWAGGCVHMDVCCWAAAVYCQQCLLECVPTRLTLLLPARPAVCPFILGNEFCERLAFYG